MKILLVNPPNCGRSIPEERYGIDSLKLILRGEPLALEVLAGNLDGHDVRIVDLKAEPDALEGTLSEFRPDILGVTALTCEANTALRIARQGREHGVRTVVVGGIHASCDPQFYNHSDVDFVVIGLGKASFRELVDALERGERPSDIPGVARTSPGEPLRWTPRCYGAADLVQEKPPRYDLTAAVREHYFLPKLGLSMGFVVSAYGCTHDCAFCCIAAQAGRRYLTHDVETVLRDLRLLGEVPVVRLVDANTFGNVAHARRLCQAIRASGMRRSLLADVRADTVVRHPDLMREWKEAGLRSVVIGFEEIEDGALGLWNKGSAAEANAEAIAILREIGITVVGDFILSPDYTEAQFDALERYLAENPVDLPMLTVLTPLPGTRLHEAMKERIVLHDLDYYTLTNAVLPTRLDERRFYERYAALLRAGHAQAKI